jgi:hypothetical protein
MMRRAPMVAESRPSGDLSTSLWPRQRHQVWTAVAYYFNVMLICLLDAQVRCGNDVAHLSPSVAVAVAVSVADAAELGRNLRRMINLLSVISRVRVIHPSSTRNNRSLAAHCVASCCARSALPSNVNDGPTSPRWAFVLSQLHHDASGSRARPRLNLHNPDSAQLPLDFTRLGWEVCQPHSPTYVLPEGCDVPRPACSWYLVSLTATLLHCSLLSR